MIVLAVDPGKVTGWATWSDGKFQAGQVDYRDFLTWVEDVIPTYAPWGLEVVTERFTIGQRTVTQGKEAHWSIGTNQILEYWCLKHEVTITQQGVSDAKKFATDDKLKKLGWYESTPGGHRNDAARHLVVHLVKHGRLELKVLT